MEKVHKIALTGGPCGGKTTALSYIRNKFVELGYNVYIVPEVATLLSNNGLSLSNLTENDIVEIEEMIIKLQMQLEDSFVNIAKLSCKKSIIVCDRGTMDALGFISSDMFDVVLHNNNWNIVNLRDSRYDAVIHLMTAAIGTNCYTLENNLARTETPEQAIQVDKKIRKAWTGHPHFRVIDNSTDFSNKIHRVIDEILRVVGVPVSIEAERKFLVKSFNLNYDDLHYDTVEINQAYLKSDNDVEERIRKRGKDGAFIYTHTTKRRINDIERVETEKIISGREYIELLGRIDTTKNKISKARHCFIWNNQYFELDVFKDNLSGLILLEIELLKKDQKIDLPSFINIDKEVTSDDRYSNFCLAKKHNE